MAALSQHYHLIGICCLDLGELAAVLGCRVAVEVAGYDVNIVVAGIPVGVLVILAAVAVVVLRGPDPDEVADALLLEVVEHRNPEFLIGLSPVVAPPEPRLGPVGLLLGDGIACGLVEGSPGGGDAGLLQLEDDVCHQVHLLVEPLVLPGAFLEGVGGSEGSLTGRTGHGLVAVGVSASAGDGCDFVLAQGHVEVPHQLHDAARIGPVGDGLGVVVVDPVVLGHVDVDEVVAVHGGILARQLIDFLCAVVVPVHVGHYT